MPSCPVCNQPLEGDFGLVNCSSCGSPVLLGMDGEAGVPENVPGSPAIGEDPVPVASLVTEAPPEPPAFEEIGFESADVSEEVIPEEPIVQDIPDVADLPELPSDPADMSDVVEYSNSDVSSAAEGSLKFNLRISGIDTVEDKKGIKEILVDSKLGLNSDEVLDSVYSGELFLEGLSSVKCAVLVQRLKSLSVDIEWEQYAIQQA